MPFLSVLIRRTSFPPSSVHCQSNRQHNRYITHVRANMKHREDGAVREVMKELLRSDLRFHKTDCGRFSAMTAWGLKDTSSRPAKDLGGTLRRTLRTTLRSYDSRASGDLFCPRRQGCVANMTSNPNRITVAAPGFYPKISFRLVRLFKY